MTALAPVLEAFFTDRLMTHAGLRAPEHAALIARVLGIQPKRTTTTIVSFLTRGELGALLAAPTAALARPPQPHPAGLRRPDRTACLRTDRAGRARRPTRHRPHAYSRGKGPQRPRYAAPPRTGAPRSSRRTCPDRVVQQMLRPVRPPVPAAPGDTPPVHPRQLAGQRRHVLPRLQPRLGPGKARPQQRQRCHRNEKYSR